ncbi:MAG: HD domain-containing phosphohydrolase [Acidobacteriota bacterium]
MVSSRGAASGSGYPNSSEVRQRVQQTRLTKLFTGVISATGLVALAYSIYRLHSEPVRLDWMFLLTFLVLLSWRAEVWIPGVSSKITLADTLIYICALMLGPWAATILASIDGLARSPRCVKSHQLATTCINVSAMSLAVLASSLLTIKFFGPLDLLIRDAERLATLPFALAFLALVNCIVNTVIVAAAVALWRKENVLKNWAENYLWTSGSFLIGAMAAGVICKAIVAFGFYAVAISLPVMLLTYLAYKTYLGKVEATNRHIEKLARLHLATIEALTTAIDARDPLNRGHVQRVRKLAEGLARALDYPEDQMEGLKAAALLHDIGKLAVPEYILSKPGKLTPAEYSKVMIHPVVGANILGNIEFPYQVVSLIKHHHERFDGTGYPDGLSGEDIPLGARIIAVVDCYEALTTNRPYRQRYSREQAIELMRRESGYMFDPRALETFLEIIDSLEDRVPAAGSLDVHLSNVETLIDNPIERGFDLAAETGTEKALRDISAAQREALSLYEISQTLSSALKLSEVLSIVGAKLESVANFTTLVIYLAEEERLRAAYAIGRNADELKGMEIDFGESGAGWVARNRQALIGGSPLADLKEPLGYAAVAYRSTAIFPLLKEGQLIGALALYSEEDRQYSADEMRLLETISAHAAAALHNALVFERTKESALTDNLTGLPNARYLYGFFEQERSRAERHGYPLALMMMDLDGLKNVNDSYGHAAGDEVLRRVAQIARAQLRTGDTLIRYAGDEFAAVLHRATPEVVIDLKTRVQSAVDSLEHKVRADRLAHVGISIGYAVYGADGHTIDELMEVADQRMYEDKIRRRHPSGPLRLATFR